MSSEILDYTTFLPLMLQAQDLVTKLESRSPEGTRIRLTADGYVYQKEANSVKIDIFWRNCPFFLETLNTVVNLNTNKMIGRVSELYEDVNNTIFSITQDKLRFERKRVRSHEEESGDTLPDGTKIKKLAPLDLFPDDEDSSEEQGSEDNEQDDDEDVPAPEETLDSILSSQKKKDSTL
ncbi:24308_t:CDS:2, partial [Entrophospora sp. SA101]